jgi:ABC-2 type transport system ATP-binding protein
VEISDCSLSYRGVSHSYRRQVALCEVDFEVRQGVTGLLGPNGAGKSTLLKIGAAEMRPSKGVVMVMHQGTEYVSTQRLYRRALGWLPQTFSVPHNFTAAEFLQYVGWLRGLSSRQLKSSAAWALALVGLEAAADDKLGTFSGGMVRRVGIAQAIVHRPSVILLDEPTVGLDPKQRSEFRRIVSELGESAAVVLSTHLTEDVGVACDRVAVLLEGRIEFLGTVEDFRRHGEHPVPGETEFDCAYRDVVELAGA